MRLAFVSVNFSFVRPLGNFSNIGAFVTFV